ncbi:MAG: RagB/SusD family nutrient uptake outer membrane protein, partial [Longimicrobiales bacterium]
MKTRFMAWVVIAVFAAACDSPLDTNPTASIDAETALNTVRGIELGLNGAYEGLEDGALFDRDLLIYPDLYADNLDFNGTFQTDRAVSLRNIPASSAVVAGPWASAYEGINRANNVLAAIPNVSALSSELASLYQGEARFIRALHYFVLVRWFTGVPIITEPSQGVGESALVSRNTAAEVYTFIEQELEAAAPLLPADRVDGRATRAAANALLARVYLEEGKHALARDRAASIISNTEYRLVPNYRDIWASQNSDESIFELQYSINNQNTLAFWFFPQAIGGRYGFAPSLGLFNAFEAGDTRRATTIALSGSNRYGAKYTR